MEFDRPDQWHAPGQWADLDAPLERLPLLVRAGGAVPAGEVYGAIAVAEERRRELLLFPAHGEATTSGSVYADDGLTHAWRDGEYQLVEWTMTSDADTVRVRLTTSGSWTPPWGELVPVLPASDGRELVVERA